MTERPDATCARCTLTAPRRGVSWPEGYVCRRCYQQATRRRGSCPGCHRDGLLPGLDTQGRPICTGCAGIEQDLTCTRCGEQDEPHRRGLCARCCLRDDLTVLLDNGTGQVAPQLAALLASLVGQPHPRSAVIWLRNPDVRRLLTGLARGELPVSHASFDAEPAARTAMHLRELLIGCGVLPPQDRNLALFQAWLDSLLPRHSPEAGRLLHGFATWHHLRRLRERSAAGGVTAGSVHTARQEITVAGQLLAHLEHQQVALDQLRQTHLDSWLARGPSTRYTARTFVVWAVKTRRLPSVTFPHRKAGQSPIITQAERLSLLRRFLHHDDDPTAERLAGVLLLLYAQPLTRIGRLTLDDITADHDTVSLRFGAEPVPLPDPVAELLRYHLEQRRNTNTAANADSPWLFPGYRPGQPLHRSYLMKLVRDAGVHLLGGRNSALRQLVLDMPPAIAAQALGYSPHVAEAHARNAGTTWVTYASYRTAITASTPEEVSGHAR